MSFLIGSRAALAVLVVAGAALSVGCASHGKHQAKAAPALPISVTVPPQASERDALGNYRFLMQQGEHKMSADQFDAWMKANGIRVAKGSPAAQ